MNIDHSNFIFSHCEHIEVESIIKSIQEANPIKFILGIFSGKAFSYPVISLKEQELYFKIEKGLKEQSINEENSTDNPYKDIPLIFASFAHNKEANIVSFTSKFYIFDYENNHFKSSPYEITNLKFDDYHLIEPVCNKIQINLQIPHFEKELLKLKEEIQHNIKTIETSQKQKIIDFNKKINIELENYEILRRRFEMYTKKEI